MPTKGGDVGGDVVTHTSEGITSKGSVRTLLVVWPGDPFVASCFYCNQQNGSRNVTPAAHKVLPCEEQQLLLLTNFAPLTRRFALTGTGPGRTYGV